MIDRKDVLWISGMTSLFIGGWLAWRPCAFLLLGFGLMLPVVLERLRATS